MYCVGKGCREIRLGICLVNGLFQAMCGVMCPGDNNHDDDDETPMAEPTCYGVHVDALNESICNGCMQI